MTLVDFILLSFATFWITHMHIHFVKKFGINLPVEEWKYCYHCVGFWYALIILLIFPQFLIYAFALCTLVFCMQSLVEGYS